MSKSALRIEYERLRGSKVCDRTWRNIKATLAILNEDDFTRFSDVQIYARLRRFSPRASIGLRDIQNARELSILSRSRCTKRDVLEAIFRIFKRYPDDRTLYRWGHEIGAPFHEGIIYTSEQVIAWVVKLIVMKEKYS